MNKSGLTFVLDRETGEYVSAFSVAENQTWIDGIGDRGELVGRKDPAVGKTINVCPAPSTRFPQMRGRCARWPRRM
jgi:hypothetical protein